MCTWARYPQNLDFKFSGLKTRKTRSVAVTRCAQEDDTNNVFKMRDPLFPTHIEIMTYNITNIFAWCGGSTGGLQEPLSSWNSVFTFSHTVAVDPVHSEIFNLSGLSRSLSLGITGVIGLDDRLLPEGPARLPWRQAAHVLQGHDHPDVVALLHHRSEDCGLCPLCLRLPALFWNIYRQPLVRHVFPDLSDLPCSCGWSKNCSCCKG